MKSYHFLTSKEKSLVYSIVTSFPHCYSGKHVSPKFWYFAGQAHISFSLINAEIEIVNEFRFDFLIGLNYGFFDLKESQFHLSIGM